MQPHRPVLTPHRLQRYVPWTLAMLAWFASVMFAGRTIDARRLHQRGEISLAWLTRMVTGLVMIRALHKLGPIPPVRHRYWLRHTKPSHFVRSLLGTRLRHALKHKDAATHIAQLIAVLRNLDAYAAQLVRAMRGRRRRLWRVVPAIAPAALVLGAPAPSPALTDSS